VIRMRRVTKIYKGSVYALEDITLDIEKGEFAFLVGPSGSGKTTFIKLLIKDEQPSSGQIYIADTNINQMRRWKVPYLRRKIGCVFQDFKLLPHKTVFQNVAYAMEVTGKSRRLTDQQVPEVLKLVGLGHKLDAFPDELSGGEQQRVAIARAFINRPPILLADEPTGNVDPSLGEGIVRLLEKINSSGTTVIMSTHDKSIVNAFRKRVIALENGRIIRDQDRGVYGYE
jgi:cell division transport system ATP-binding protein